MGKEPNDTQPKFLEIEECLEKSPKLRLLYMLEAAYLLIGHKGKEFIICVDTWGAC